MKRNILLSAALILPMLSAGMAVAQTAGPASPAQGTSSAMAPGQPGKSAAPAMAPANAAPAMAAPVMGSSARISKLDKMFVTKATESGLAEVQAAQLAQQKSQDAAVKAFAQGMIDDHTAANEKLTTVASSKDIIAPTEPNAGQKKVLSRLQGLEGSKFDRVYMASRIKAHEMMLKLFQREAANGKDADLKAFAETTVPAIEKHITMAKATK